MKKPGDKEWSCKQCGNLLYSPTKPNKCWAGHEGLMEEIPVCPKCNESIDPNTCYCGEPPNGVHDNHHFVPMGCRCFERN